MKPENTWFNLRRKVSVLNNIESISFYLWVEKEKAEGGLPWWHSG